MIAARVLTDRPCYVVDCGTAVTIDALAADGRHLGGVIIPGMRLMREALYRETRQIPRRREKRGCSARVPATAFGAERCMRSPRR